MTVSEPRARLTSRAEAAFLVPVLAILALLYQGLAAVDVSVSDGATLLVIGATAAVAVTLGLIAARGGDRTRIVVFSATTVLLLDVSVHPSRLFDAIFPSHRLAVRRDLRRVADLHHLKTALDAYIQQAGALPEPALYGEGTGPETFWAGWWDLSAVDGNGDGRPFLDFLAARGVRVPHDPLNTAPDAVDPRTGHQYVYFVVPAGYPYHGGTCAAWAGKWVYLLGARFETTDARPPAPGAGSDCTCLWQEAPDFFKAYFDYRLCGTFQK